MRTKFVLLREREANGKVKRDDEELVVSGNEKRLS